MADASLTRMFEEVRWQTLRILDGVTQGEARWAPAGLQNTILWHAGHAYVVVEWCTLQSLGRESQYPDKWFEIFSGMELKTDQVPPDGWPQLANVVDELKKQRGRLRELYAGLSESDLSAEAAHKPQRTVRYMILHGLYDAAGDETR